MDLLGSPRQPSPHTPSRGASPSGFKRALGKSPATLLLLTALSCIGFWVLVSGFIEMPSNMGNSFTALAGVRTGNGLLDTPGPTMPRGLVVVVAGLQRSGSTALYNLARLLMSDQDPNLITFYLHTNLSITGQSEKHVQMCRDKNVSVLIKLHQPEMLARLIKLDLVDVLLSSYRPPVEMLCSNAILFQPQWREFETRGWARMCEQRLNTQNAIYKIAAERGGRRKWTPTSGIEYDMQFFPHDIVQTLEHVGELLQIRDLPQWVLERMAVAFGRITDHLPEKWHIPNWVHHPNTMMHSSHSSSSHSDKLECYERMRKAAKLSLSCSQWQARGGAHQPPQ